MNARFVVKGADGSTVTFVADDQHSFAIVHIEDPTGDGLARDALIDLPPAQVGYLAGFLSAAAGIGLTLPPARESDDVRDRTEAH